MKMDALVLKCILALTLVRGTVSTRYVPGTPGINWTEKQAEIIRNKLHYLWDNKLDVIKKFDFNNAEAPISHTKYLYDPDRRLSTVDCDWNEMLCRVYWSDKRIRDIAFSETKAVR